MAQENGGFTFDVVREEDFRFRVEFDQEGVPILQTDEPPPLGRGEGPNPARLLAAAVANCLAASLLFCLGKSRVEVGDLRARVRGTVVRNEQGRLRIGHLSVILEPEVAGGEVGRMDRCLEIFEDFCIVTQSVRDGLDVEVAVRPVEAAGVGR